MLRKILFLILISLSLVLTACSQTENKNVITVGTIAGPSTEIMQAVKKVALEKYGLQVKIVVFNDYTIPNAALANGSLDANAFQHTPFLDAQIKQRGYKLTPIGKTFIFPMAVYSEKYKKLSEIPDHAKIAVPNDPSNEARALLLLQKGGLITLKPNAGMNATSLDIVENPKHLNIVSLDAAQLPRVLKDVAAAVITNDYAGPAGLNPNQSLLEEGKDSLYANVIVARDGEMNHPALKKKLEELVQAYQSKAVIAAAEKITDNQAVVAF